ncbi:magnesium transporter CorA family protein [Salinibacterium sp. ZJ450]|uniref:magnesium transporter CorA family protein n=1 Tax=Salinibacterium sp. ZJ450 TaxID=2708338 RepID=UPI001CD61FE9|nr:magnesium transporter CorA family protein [Salinibacterium sp. ZJ450]
MNTRLYRHGALESRDFPMADVSDLVLGEGVAVWADFISPTAEDLAQIEEELGLHHLAIEDAVHEYQRPKLDRYDTHLFLAAYSATLDPETGELQESEVKAFITPHALITIHGPEFDMSPVVRRWDNDSRLSTHGASFLLWGLLDEIVDGHFDTVQGLDEQIDSLEEALFAEKPRNGDIQRRSFELRKSLVRLRRIVMPMREVVNTIMRRDFDVMPREMMPYFQDVYDHVLRATDWTDSLRDLVTTILETNVGLQGNRMNMIMKKVTSWAAIIAVPTAITGYYGQNVPYPGFAEPWGFWFSSASILVISFGLYFTFKRQDWL